MAAYKDRLPSHTAKAWALDAKCASPGGRALIDLLADYPSNWKNCHVWERIRTLCDECPVKAECRRLGEEHAANSSKWDAPSHYIPYAGYPLKHYRDNLAA